MRIERTPLPGIGIRYNFTTESGQEIGVICHVSGNREIVVYETDDTDKVRCTTPLGIEEAHHLSDLLRNVVTADQVAKLTDSVNGVNVTRIEIDERSPFAGQFLNPAELADRTGASVIAVIRGGEVMADPAVKLRVGDRVVAAGKGKPITKLTAVLTGDE
ncbi:potassium/proton antiporter regulatory subunit (CPA2 family) [Stackebrandtia endophytica]|uniref:Potassium/proton antiporter regulatory subunit (CPA2 family) n=1 Tax=Stackebrandtia endophytica TaxID=1496996 RepID=A0A543AVG7_9ACTN|nr:TrkA C-terminal domain-containing protein [Stackebrandtia endophytica]TQL76580.1 potassium/proton antiporter regulatory subunit (CPA2 family) [Stackebrandtia endophytica]